MPSQPGRAATKAAQLAAFGVVPSGVTDDSRQVSPGDLFLAYPGDLSNGHRFIGDAIANGAVAVFLGASTWQFLRPGTVAGGSPTCQSAGLRALCRSRWRRSSTTANEHLSLVAVTGTNGKTTASTQWIANTHPRRCAIIGTLGAGLPGRLLETGFTTPEATMLMRSLASFVADEVQACALEASSIGIAKEGRLDGARVEERRGIHQSDPRSPRLPWHDG